jgi:hypothetical protein
MNRPDPYVIGIIVTIVWAMTCLWLLFSKTDASVKINEWGDVMSGFCAPITFFWLILGYIQQAKELRQSTQALQLQAQQLVTSVGQQEKLVELTRQQVNDGIRALLIQQEQARRSVLPQFVFPMERSESECLWSGVLRFNALNVGNTALELRFCLLASDGRELSHAYHHSLRHGEKLPLTVDLSTGEMEAVVLRLTYLDSGGTPHMGNYELRVREDTPAFICIDDPLVN